MVTSVYMRKGKQQKMAGFEQKTDWAMGLMFGLAIGDAMGAPIEF